MADDPMQNVSRAARGAFDAMQCRATVAERRAEAAERLAAEAERRANEAAARSLDAHALHAIMDRLDVMADRLDALEMNQRRRDVAPKSCGPAEDGDLLYGMPAIAAHLGLKVPQARHLSDKGTIPTFKLPGNKNTCASRSALATWIAEASNPEGR